MRTREEVVKLMGAKDREVDYAAETPAGTVVSILGFRSLIRPDGSMVHGVPAPRAETAESVPAPTGEEVEVVEELDAQRMAALIAAEKSKVAAPAKPAPVKKTTGKKG